MSCDKDCNTLAALKQRLVQVQDLLVESLQENKDLKQQYKEKTDALVQIHNSLYNISGPLNGGNMDNNYKHLCDIGCAVSNVLEKEDFD